MTAFIDTLSLQTALAAHRCDPGPIDGWFGAKTLRGLMDWTIHNPGYVPLEAAQALILGLKKYGLNTPPRTIQMLANCGVESGFKLVEESLSYSPGRLSAVWPSRFPDLETATPYAYNPEKLANMVYGGRMGNTRPGDGWLYRGRSWPQLTGHDAYDAVSRVTGLDLLNDPGLCMTYPGAAESACGFWTWKDLSPIADAQDTAKLRRRWNGGNNGLPEVTDAVARLYDIWSVK